MERKKTDEEERIHILLGKIKNGDREAFMEVVSLFQKKVFLLAFSFFQNREDAMDIVQETFLRFYQKIHSFEKGKNFQNWILQIAKNLCIDFYRKNYRRKREFSSDISIDGIKVSQAGESDYQHSSDIKKIISHCLKKLSERQRMILVMKSYNQLKYREIAQIMGISLGTVKSLHFKAVQNLRKLASPYLGME